MKVFWDVLYPSKSVQGWLTFDARFCLSFIVFKVVLKLLRRYIRILSSFGCSDCYIKVYGGCIEVGAMFSLHLVQVLLLACLVFVSKCVFAKSHVARASESFPPEFGPEIT